MGFACHLSDGEMRGGRQREVDPGKLMGQLSGSKWQRSKSMRECVSNKIWKVPKNYTQGCPLTPHHHTYTENTYTHVPSRTDSPLHTQKKVKEKKTKNRNSSKYGSLIHRNGSIQKKTSGILWMRLHLHSETGLSFLKVSMSHVYFINHMKKCTVL